MSNIIFSAKDNLLLSTELQLPEEINIHSWNNDHTLLACGMKFYPILIVYRVNWSTGPSGIKFEEIYRNDVDFVKRVTGISWSNSGNQLAICTEDNKGFVYDFTNGDKPFIRNIVLEKVSHSCTAIAWSPDDSKIALTVSSMVAVLVEYNKDFDNYMARVVTRKLEAPIISIAWHPSSLLFALGASNGYVYLVRAADTAEGVTEYDPTLPLGFGPQSEELLKLEIEDAGDKKKKKIQQPILLSVQLSSAWVVGLEFISGNGFSDFSQDAIVAVTADSRIHWFDASCAGCPRNTMLAEMTYRSGYKAPRVPVVIPLPIVGIQNIVVLRNDSNLPTIILSGTSGDQYICTSKGSILDGTFTFVYAGKLELLESSATTNVPTVSKIQQKALMFSRLNEVKLQQKNSDSTNIHDGVVSITKMDITGWSSSSNKKIVLWKLK